MRNYLPILKEDQALKHFIKYYKAHLPLFFLDFCCAFVLALLDLVFPLVVTYSIDTVIPAKSLRLLLIMGIGLLLLNVLRSILSYIVDYWGHVLGARIEHDMRSDLFSHIQKLSFTYFDNTKTGHIMSRLVNDLNEVSELAHHGPEDLFITIVTLTGSFIIMMQLHWKLTLIIFSVLPFMLAFSIIKNRQMQRTFREMRLRVADINAQVEDSISGIRVVKSFTNEGFEQQKFEKGNYSFKKTRESAFKIMGHFFSGIGFLSNLINLLVLTIGIYFIYNGQLAVGQLTGFLLYVSMFLQPIKRITTLVENYQKGMAGFQRFHENISIVPDIMDSPNAMEVKRLIGDVEFKDVSFSYNNHKSVLDNINLKVKAGETIAFVGPSGAGKTTLCSLIPRFYEIDKGSISIDDIDIKSMTQRSLRANIGIVQQDVFLFSGTIRENIAYGKINSSDEEVVEAAKLANAHEFIVSLENGYDTYIGERGVKLSGGQKQRISIARIFLKNPPILILDEATSALDNETEKVIQESFNRLSESRTTLVIAHRLGTIRDADRILVLTEEGIVEDGSHKELMESSSIYSRLYKAQFIDYMI